MAIALTLLVLEIRIPQVSDPAELPAALLDDVATLDAYVIAFAPIASNWMSHHRKFTVIERYNGRSQFIKFVYPFFIVLMPVPIVFLSSIVVALFFGSIPAMFGWFVMIPVAILVGRWTPRSERGHTD